MAPGLTIWNKKLLGTKGISTRSKKLLVAPSLIWNKKLLGTKGISTRSKKLLVAPGLTIWNKKLPGLTIWNKKLLGTKGISTRSKKLLYSGSWSYFLEQEAPRNKGHLY